MLPAAPRRASARGWVIGVRLPGTGQSPIGRHTGTAMMTIRISSKTILSISLCLLLACACSDGTAPDKVEATEAESQEDTDGVYQRPVDKARNVEDQLQEGVDKHKRDLRDQEGGG